MGDQLNRMARAAHQLSQKLGREPSTEELAEAMGTTKAWVEDALEVSQRPVSLEASNGEEDDTALGEFIPDVTSPSPADTVTESGLREDLQEILGTLPPREVLALRLRFGLVDGKSYTLEEVGQKMGVTRERVRQLESQAFRRLRLPAHRRKLSEYLKG
jgi:RNA polymerase primary sigma factor